MNHVDDDDDNDKNNGNDLNPYFQSMAKTESSKLSSPFLEFPTFQKEDIACPIKSVYLTTTMMISSESSSSSSKNPSVHVKTRCIYSKGPWIESTIIQSFSTSPLQSMSNDSHHQSSSTVYNNNDLYQKDFYDIYKDTTDTSSQRHCIFTHTSSFSSSSSTYRHLVFNRGGSIHGIRKVKISTLNNTNSIYPSQPELWIVFGARQFTIITGGFSNPFQSCYFYEQRKQMNPLKTSRREIPIQNNNNNICSFITVSDWIWDIQPILLPSSNDDTCSTTNRDRTIPSWDDCYTSSSSQTDIFNQGPILLAIGLAHNAVDLWLLGSFQTNHDRIKNQNISSSILLWTVRLRKVVCEVRCITLCMHFCGWDWESHNSNNNNDHNHHMDYSLRIMVGTVSNQILVWNILSMEEGGILIQDAIQMYQSISYSNPRQQLDIIIDEVETRMQPTQHTLLGHDGVIFSCTSIVLEENHHRYIASVSDDRTLRLWKSKLIDGQESSYELAWTGYGHTARIWNCTFISWEYYDIPLDCIITCGEDNTIRLWNIEDGQVLSIMQGHQCQSIWKMSVNEWFDHRTSYRNDLLRPLVVSGANDGTVKCWDLTHHIYQYALNEKSIIHTDDLTTNINVKANVLKKHVSMRTRRIYKIEPEVTSSCKTNANKKMGVSICGMKFYPRTPGKLLVATRDGHLRTLNVHSGDWIHHQRWAYHMNKLSMNGDLQRDVEKCLGSPQNFVNPDHGCCITIHTLENVAVIGTTKGDIIIISFMKSSGIDPIHVSSAKRFLAIHSVDWVNQNTLISFHVNGVAVLWSFEKIILSSLDNNLPQIDRALVITIKGVTVGIPLCFTHDCLNSILFLGDSRGNVAAFDFPLLKEDECSPYPEYLSAVVAPFVHGKEHVRGMALSHPDTLVSVGNDGLIHVCTYFKDGADIILLKAYSVPVSNLTALSHVWVESRANEHSRIVVAGFYGNEFSIWDASSSYRLLHVPIGSRQRSYDLCFDMKPSILSSKYQFTMYATANEDPSEFQFFFKDYLSDEGMVAPYYSFKHSLGTLCHGETVLDIAVLSIDHNQQVIFTGANDGTLKTSLYDSGAIVEVIDIAKFETCIRSLCCSKHMGSKSALLVVCGGKNVTSFYSCNQQCTYFLCQNRRLLKSQDHRINAVHAVPLLCSRSVDFYHLVVTGDSEGMLSFFVASEKLGQPRRLDGQSLRRSTMGYGSVDESVARFGDYPILDLDIVRVTDNAIIVAIGDTTGSIQLWLWPGIICDEKKCFMGDLSPRPFAEYSAHQMGTNAIKMIITGCDRIGSYSYSVRLMIISGGDDQALCIAYFNIMLNEERNDGPSVMYVHVDKKEIVGGASSSAIKGIYVSGLLCHRNKWLVYTVGYEESLVVWEIDALERKITYRSSIKVDVSDVESLNGFTSSGRDILIVCGQGMEILSLQNG